MTNEQINIAIAKALGLTVVSDGISHNLTPCDLETGKYSPEGKGLDFIPDYCNDLKAIHDAVMTLPENKQILYGMYLAWACGHTAKGSVGLWKISTATARQRAEAFLRTLGKWVE